MSGIAGWVATGRAAADEAALAPMLATLAHRGVEALVGYVDRGARQQAVLGASLVDQPSAIALVLDGTLDNAAALRAELLQRGFRFGGESPEEVLLRAYQYWDKDVVKRLAGAFAFAIWDARKERLFLARDRFGQKPLFLHQANGRLSFASEAKAILRVPDVQARVDLQALWQCLGERYVTGPRTLFSGIRKLNPASSLQWQLGRLNETRYWNLPDAAASRAIPKSGYSLEILLGLLREAVRFQPGEAIFLSGGVDSAILVALAALQGAAIRTFSLGLEGERKSELPLATPVAKYFGTEHQEIVVSPRELLGGLNKLVALRDAPLARPSDLAVYRLACEAGRSATVAIAGDGCDEIFGGYRRYAAVKMAGSITAFPARLLAPLAHAGRFDTATPALRLNEWRTKLWVSREREFAPDKELSLKNLSRFRRALVHDQAGWLPDQVLERIDRAACAGGIEVRLPYLDPALAELAAALPDELRVKGLRTKRVLHEAAGALLPAQLQRRRQGGWRLDAGEWLRTELRDMLLDHLQGGGSQSRAYYDGATLDRVIDEHLHNRKNHETLLWTLLNIEIWHRACAPG